MRAAGPKAPSKGGRGAGPRGPTKPKKGEAVLEGKSINRFFFYF